MHNMADSESEKSVVDDAHLEAASQMLDTAEATSMLQQRVTSIKDAAAHRLQEDVSGIKDSKHHPFKPNDIQQKVLDAVDILQLGLVERDLEVRLLLLAAIAGEHVLFIGPPGTAKSELGRRLAALHDGLFFERLLTRFSVPEEIFGPLSLQALEKDQYLRKTSGYLPEASVAFLDEIFKANSSILNSLLTILNERAFDNGAVRGIVPLVCLVGASNELPESEELDALYDRFLIRRQVPQVSSTSLITLLTLPPSTDRKFCQSPITLDDMSDIRKTSQNVRVSPHVLTLIGDLRHFIQTTLKTVNVSDRRLVKAMALLKIVAKCDGRDEVTLSDCLLLQHVLWQRPEHSDVIRKFITDRLAANHADGLDRESLILSGLVDRAKEASSLEEVKQEVDVLKTSLLTRLAFTKDLLAEAAGKQMVQRTSVWLTSEESQAVTIEMYPALEVSQSKINTMIESVICFQEWLEMSEPSTDVLKLLMLPHESTFSAASQT